MTEKTVVQLIADVMSDVTSVGKGDRNDFHKFMFRGIDRVINAVGPALRTHGVVVLPNLLTLESRDVQTEKGKTSREVTVSVAYTFHGPAGDSLTCTVPGEAQDVGDKAVSKAMSVAYRTALIQSLSIPTDERDPDSQSYVRPDDEIAFVKRQIMAAAKSREWDVEALAVDFAAWREGADIREADLSTLQQYLKQLNPPKKARRAPVPVVDLPAPDEAAPPRYAVDVVFPEPSL